jgi:hypothetical protein
MSYPLPPQQPPPYGHYGMQPAVSLAPRNWTGVLSLVCAILASGAAASCFGLLVASHGGFNSSGCLVDQNMVTAALYSALGGVPFSGFAVIWCVAGLFGRRRTRGVYRWAGIGGLLLGLVALLACAVLLLAVLGSGPGHPC